VKKFALFNVVFPVAGFGVGTAVTQTLLITRDADYVATALTFIEQAAAPVLSNFTVQFSDTAENENWFDFPVSAVALNGNGQLPYYLPAARLIPANNTVTIIVTSAAAAVGNVHVTLHGFKTHFGPEIKQKIGPGA
jgi:hypothetical protein